MIQVLGWLGCLYLLVKGLDIISRMHERPDTFSQVLAGFAAVIAIVGSLGCFALVMAATGGFGVLWR